MTTRCINSRSLSLFIHEPTPVPLLRCGYKWPRLNRNDESETIARAMNDFEYTLSKFKRSLNRVDFSAFYGMRSRSCFYIECLFFFWFLWAKCKRQFSVPFVSCSCSRVDHVCVFLFSWFEQINDDDDDGVGRLIKHDARSDLHQWYFRAGVRQCRLMNRWSAWAVRYGNCGLIENRNFPDQQTSYPTLLFRTIHS